MTTPPETRLALDVPDGTTHMRRPEYITAWLFDRISTMPVWLIAKYKSDPLPAKYIGHYATAVDGEFWRWFDPAKFNELFVNARTTEPAGAGLKEVQRLLTKIIDLAYDEDVGEPLDDAIGYANKALFALNAALATLPTERGELNQGTSAVASTTVRSPNTEIASSLWQPIQSAPKDGTAILIFEPGRFRDYHMPNGALGRDEFSYRTDDPRLQWYDDNRFAIGYWRPWGGWGNRNCATVNPTHWMPLPAAPQTQVADNLTGASANDTGNCPQTERGEREEIAREAFIAGFEAFPGPTGCWDREKIRKNAESQWLKYSAALPRPVPRTIEDAGESQ